MTLIKQGAFYTALSKGVKTGVYRPDNLMLQGKVLRGLHVALILIKSHIQLCPLKGRHLLAWLC